MTDILGFKDSDAEIFAKLIPYQRAFLPGLLQMLRELMAEDEDRFFDLSNLECSEFSQQMIALFPEDMVRVYSCVNGYFNERWNEDTRLYPWHRYLIYKTPETDTVTINLRVDDDYIAHKTFSRKDINGIHGWVLGLKPLYREIAAKRKEAV
jgi:hypothetical protein